MKKDYLVLKDLNELRRAGRLSTEEIAYKVGDSIIAYHPVTKEERFIKSDDLLLESFRTILKD